MSSRKQSPLLLLLRLALLAAALFFLFMAFMPETPEPVTEVFLPHTSQAETTAYLELAGVSPGVMPTEGGCYHAAVDSRGDLYTLLLPAETFALMASQQSQWGNALEDPVLYRLEGCVREVPEQTQLLLGNLWKLPEGSFQQYFGALCLDARPIPPEFPWLWTGAAGLCLGALLLSFLRRRTHR